MKFQIVILQIPSVDLSWPAFSLETTEPKWEKVVHSLSRKSQNISLQRLRDKWRVTPVVKWAGILILRL